MTFEFSITYGEAYKKYRYGINNTYNTVSDSLINFLIDIYLDLDEIIYYIISDCLEKAMDKGVGKGKAIYYDGVIRDDPAMDAKYYIGSEWSLAVKNDI